ncbi:MAG: redox-regulated ATPase YchF [Candidatus Riflebacteria bacterium]|nr:redox-regulated ATPase YchF [Candidatus Riflebacteria bacterium]
MKIGLAGLPMSGKTSIFNMATRAKAQTRDYLAQSDEINSGIIKVPDNRIDHLTTIFKPKKTTFATVEFTDIPGISNSENKSASKILANIRTCEAIMLVVRLFESEEIPHIHNKIDPAADLEELCLEFIFSDLEMVTNRIERLQKEIKVVKKPEATKELELMEHLRKTLEDNKFISTLELTEEQEQSLRGYRLLTQKPLLLIGNCSDTQFATADAKVAAFTKACEERGWSPMLISAATEMEISALSPEEEAVFLEEFGMKESGRNRLISAAYRLLNYISFLTVGEDEVRAWPLQRGTTALKSAGKIHSDIERGFIRAEVVAYDDFVSKGSMVAVKAAGLSRLEGKEYIVEDGDIINFRFNV